MRAMCARIRMVSNSDLKDILEISRQIWGDHDYLPSVIGDWLKDLNSYTCGVEVDKRLVAVYNLRLVEDGQTGWMEGLRVHREYRWKGFATALTEHVIQKAEKLGVQRLRYTTATANEASMKLAERFGFAITLEMSVFWHPNLKASPSPSDFPSIRRSDPGEIHKLLQSSLSVMPSRILFYDWKAVDCTLEGLKEVGKSREFHIALREGELTSLSYGGLRQGLEQSSWAFTIYAVDSTGFLAHIWHNIAEASRRGVSSITGTHEVNFEKALQRANWLSQEYWTMRMVLLEKILRQT